MELVGYLVQLLKQPLSVQVILLELKNIKIGKCSYHITAFLMHK
jgi:hypothetical protein